MRIFGRHKKCSITLRAAALPVLAFYALAVGRSLIPGMCATQTAALKACEEESGPTCCSIARPSTAGADETPTFQGNSAAVECAFCDLATSLVQPIYMALLQCHIANDKTHQEHPVIAPDLPECWNAGAPRDPPSCA